MTPQLSPGANARGAATPCDFCGYPFDQEMLGRYGCPNCHGEGLADTSFLFLGMLVIVSMLFQQPLNRQLNHLRPVQDEVRHQASAQRFEFVEERLIEPNCNLCFSHEMSLAYANRQRQPKTTDIFFLTFVLRCDIMGHDERITMTTWKQVVAMAKKLGATIDREHGRSDYVQLDAPKGKVWNSNGCHCLCVEMKPHYADWGAKFRSECYAGLIKGMEYGLEDCDDAECEVCRGGEA